MEDKYSFLTKVDKILLEGKTLREIREDGYEYWIWYYRNNIDLFISDYLRINLKDFQRVVTVTMSDSSLTIMIATRGLGKTFIAAIYALAMGILYPNSLIVVVAKTQTTANRLISEKIPMLADLSPIIKAEILDDTNDQNRARIELRSGSKITASCVNENARGQRANILIIDEAPKIPKGDLESIAIPFVSDQRYAGYRNVTKYEHYPVNMNQTIFLTSAWFKNHYFYETYYRPNIDKMMDPNKANKTAVFNFDVNMALLSGLVQKEQNDQRKESMSDMVYAMEVMSIFYGEREDALFKLKELLKCRRLSNVYIPLTKLDITQRKKSNFKKKKNEIRIMSADIALASGNKNDNSIFTLGRLLPSNGGREKQICYMESHNGMDATAQAVRLKQLFIEFEADKMIIDTKGVGLAVFSELRKVNYDEETGIEYPAFSAYNEDDLLGLEEGYLPVVYSLKPTKEINHKIALALTKDFNKASLILPIDETEASDMLEKDKTFYSASPDVQVKRLTPFIETSAMVSELINLEYALLDGGLIKVSEKGSARKDRYSSIAYWNYLADMIIDEEKDSLKNSSQMIMFT